MTEVAFHFNAPDKLGYACRLLRKAVANGAKVVVTGDPALLRELDIALWTFSALDFVPHCHGATTAPAVVEASPVVLAESARVAPHQQVLVNLGAAVPDGFEGFERLIEVVTAGGRRPAAGPPALEALCRPGLRHHAPRPRQGGRLMSSRTPPRYVPTLTEVVQANARAAGRRRLPTCRQEQLIARVMQRVDLTLERRLREAIASTVLEQTRSIAPLLRDEIESAVRQSRVAGLRRRTGGRATSRRNRAEIAMAHH